MHLFSRQLSTRTIVYAGCLFTLLYVIFSDGFYHPDEYYQILEFAHMRLFGTPPSDLPWEYQTMMRPGFQPLIAYGFGKLLTSIHFYDPFILQTLLRLLSGTLSVVALLVFCRALRPFFQTASEKRWYLILGFFVWFMAYFHVRFSSETLSGNLLLLLVSMLMFFRQKERRHPFLWGLWMGLLAGAAFIVRFQVGFALLGFGLWLLVYLRKVSLLSGLGLGVVAMLGVGTAADRWLYGIWTCTPLNYLHENILQGHIDSFGIDPWWYYLAYIPLEGGILFGILLLAATLIFIWKNLKHPLTWMLIPFLIAHQAIGHKEVRFLFPILAFAPYILLAASRYVPTRFLRSKGARIIGWTTVSLNVLIIVFNLTIRNTDIAFYHQMRELCPSGKTKAILNLKKDKTFYSYYETTLFPRAVSGHYFLPAGTQRLLFDTLPDMERSAQSFTEQQIPVFILSEDPQLDEHFSVPLQKIDWNPYPQWIVRYFNFNDWVGLSVRRKNLYRVQVVLPGEAGPKNS